MVRLNASSSKSVNTSRVPPAAEGSLQNRGRSFKRADGSAPRLRFDFNQIPIVPLTSIQPQAPSGDASAIAEQGFSGAASEVPYRREMEAIFGQDLGAVRAYRSGAATKASAALNAQAFTMGHRIGFGTAAPSRAIVAHELTHVLQHARSPRGEGAVDASGEAEAMAVERAVASGRPLHNALRGAGSIEAASQRQSGPALRPLDYIIGPKGKPTRGRYSDITTVTGKTRVGELQIMAIPPWTVPLAPGITGQLIPEIKILAGHVAGDDGSSSLTATLSGRVIFLLSGGILKVIEVFGSFTAFFEAYGVLTRGASAEELSDGRFEVTLRGGLRAGVRSLARFLEWSWDQRLFQLARIVFLAHKEGGKWQGKFAAEGLMWSPEAIKLVDLIGTKIREAATLSAEGLRQLGWVAYNVASIPGTIVAGAITAAREKLNPANWDLKVVPPSIWMEGRGWWVRTKTGVW